MDRHADDDTQLIQVEQIRKEKKELEDQLQAEMGHGPGASNESDRIRQARRILWPLPHGPLGL